MNKKGITILELIIVCVIIAIGTLLLVPSIGSWVNHYRLRTAVRDVVSIMRVAQMKAVATNMEYQVKFSYTTYMLQYRSSSGSNWVTEGSPKLLPSGVAIIKFPPWSKFEFNPNYTTSTGSLTLQNAKGHTKRITLTTATGRIRVISP